MRAALFAVAALAAGANAETELPKCDITQRKLPERCELAVTSQHDQTSKQLARATVGGLWFAYGLAVDAFATPTEGTIILVTNHSNVDNAFAMPVVQAQATVEQSVPKKGGLLLQQRELPVCDAPTPPVTRTLPDTACELNSRNPAPKGCGILFSAVNKSFTSADLATTLVGTLHFGFGKGASALNSTTEGQVVLVLEEEVPTMVLAAFDGSPHLTIEKTALPTGAGKVLSGPQTCTELRVFNESESNSDFLSAASKEAETEADQASAVQSSSAMRAAISAVWMLVAAAFAQ